MREIKFQGKRLDNGEWVQGYYFVTPLTDEATNSSPEDGWSFLAGRERHCISQDHCVYEIDPETIGEYIGLHDKNNIEIYENYILRHKFGGTGIVKFNKHWGSFCYSTLTGKNEYGDIVKMIGSHSFYSDANTYEIIGEAHDNPELVNSGWK